MNPPKTMFQLSGVHYRGQVVSRVWDFTTSCVVASFLMRGGKYHAVSFGLSSHDGASCTGSPVKLNTNKKLASYYASEAMTNLKTCKPRNSTP